jgi:hypothetical protein
MHSFSRSNNVSFSNRSSANPTPTPNLGQQSRFHQYRYRSRGPNQPRIGVVYDVFGMERHYVENVTLAQLLKP